MSKQFFGKQAAAVLAIILLPLATAQAISYDISNRTESLGDLDARSYDGSGYNALTPFAGFVGPDLLQLNSFTADPFGDVLQVTLLAQVAHYDGRHGIGADSFGLYGSGGFIPMLSGAMDPGYTASLTLAGGQAGRFSLTNPEGEQFYSRDLDNPDKAAHMVALRVIKDGTIFIPLANLFGATLTYNVLAGDLIILNEDLRSTGNSLYGGMASDLDYNDMTVLVRSQAIPEPSTLLLLGGGLAVAFMRRKRA